MIAGVWLTIPVAVLALMLWAALVSVTTYKVTSNRRQQQIDVLEHHLREAYDDLDDAYYHSMNADAHVDYEIDSQNFWRRMENE